MKLQVFYPIFIPTPRLNICFSFTMSSSLKPCSSPNPSTTFKKDTDGPSQQLATASTTTITTTSTNHHKSCRATTTTKTMDTIPRFFFPFGKPVVPEERECKDRKIMVSRVHISMSSNAPFHSPMSNILYIHSYSSMHFHYTAATIYVSQLSANFMVISPFC